MRAQTLRELHVPHRSCNGTCASTRSCTSPGKFAASIWLIRVPGFVSASECAASSASYITILLPVKSQTLANMLMMLKMYCAGEVDIMGLYISSKAVLCMQRAVWTYRMLLLITGSQPEVHGSQPEVPCLQHVNKSALRCKLDMTDMLL